MSLIVQSTKPGGPSFRVLRYNPDTKMGVLVGSLGKEFEHSLDRDYLIKNHYKIVAEGSPEAVPPPAPVHSETGPASAFAPYPFPDPEE